MKTDHSFKPRNKNFRTKVEESFALQKAMKTIGCTIKKVDPGHIELEFPYDEKFTQQHGFIHAGILATAMDSACGYAAFSLMPENAGVLAVEFKINFLAPAKGEKIRVVGEVLKPGRTISVCQAEAFTNDGRGEKLVSQMTGTIMTVYDREGISN